VDQLADETRGARFFTKLDLASAYWQFRIRPEDQFKTSFRVPGGQYEFRVGAFGLHGMSSLLMRYMHSVFGRPAIVFDAAGRAALAGPATPSTLGRFVQVYCDDILIFSKTREEHLVHVRMVLETLRHHQLFAKASKCQFLRSPVGFLGHVISERGITADPRKVPAVAEWATPTSCTDVRRFIGLANYTVSLCCASPPSPPHLLPCAAREPSSRGVPQSSRASMLSKRPSPRRRSRCSACGTRPDRRAS
jgi:hypothetical protein